MSVVFALRGSRRGATLFLDLADNLDDGLATLRHGSALCLLLVDQTFEGVLNEVGQQHAISLTEAPEEVRIQLRWEVVAAMHPHEAFPAGDYRHVDRFADALVRKRHPEPKRCKCN